MKLRQFLIFESIAVALLLASIWLAMATHLGTGASAGVFRLLPLAPAVAVTLLPILYFALPPRFPRERRSDTP
jgi:hypothetical protein